MDIKDFGQKIKTRRLELNMTQKDLANKLFISSQLVSKWENNESVPSLNYIKQLCIVLSISVKDLLEDKNIKKEKIDKSKLKKILFISLTGVAGVIIITIFILLSIYTFIPNANKQKYINAIEKSIQEYIDNNNYYNIKYEIEIDGEVNKTLKLQGYFENNNICSYNSITNETIKDNILSDVANCYYYTQPENIKNINDLLESELKTISNQQFINLDNIENNIKVKYVRDISSGYYIEFDNEFFKNMLSENQQNIKLISKITGKIIFKENQIQSITISFKYKNVSISKIFKAKSTILFIAEKPVIEHKVATDNIIKILDKPNVSTSNFMNDLCENTSVVLNKDDEINTILKSKKFFLTKDEEICYLKDREIVYYNINDLSLNRCENFITNKNIINGLTYQNDYIYNIENSILTLYDNNLNIRKIIDFSSYNSAKDFYLFNNFIYYIYHSNDNVYFEKMNLDTLVVENINQYYCASFSYDNENIQYNKNFAFGGYYSYNLDNNTKSKSDSFIYYVDRVGNLYFDYPVFSTYKETDKAVYIIYNYDNSEITRYSKERGEYIEKLNYYKNTFSGYKNFGDYVVDFNKNKIYSNLDTDDYIELPHAKIYNKLYTFYDCKIEVIDDKLLVGYFNYVSYFSDLVNEPVCLAYYSKDDLVNPIDYIMPKSIILINSGNTLFIYTQDDNNNCLYFALSYV